MRFHCLQHVAFETPGIIANWILEQRHELSITGFFQNDPLPTVDQFDALVIMGGPMSIHDEKDFPWLKKEKELIARAIRQEKKILGICLGAQLIAGVAGARVYPNPEKEIGFLPVGWTAAARQLLSPLPSLHSASSLRPALGDKGRGWPETSLVFHWHGETFDLPDGAVHLAFTDACVNQAFLLGQAILGLQFHLEVTADIVREMIAREGHELVPAPYIQPAATILQQLSCLEASKQLLYPLLDQFFHA